MALSVSRRQNTGTVISSFLSQTLEIILTELIYPLILMEHLLPRSLDDTYDVVKVTIVSKEV